MIVLANVVILLFTVVYFVLVERAATRIPGAPAAVLLDLRAALLAARTLLEAAAATSYIQVFNGTPFKNAIWRLLGVRLGRRVFDDGCGMPERTLVTIGDDGTLNAGSVIQCHSQEDGTFKSDRITIGAGCTARDRRLGPLRRDDGRRRGARPRLLPHEGRGRPAHASWGGNPARELRNVGHRTTTAASSWPR